MAAPPKVKRKLLGCINRFFTPTLNNSKVV